MYLRRYYFLHKELNNAYIKVAYVLPIMVLYTEWDFTDDSYNLLALPTPVNNGHIQGSIEMSL